MRLSPPWEMRLDSPALCPEQLRFPNQTRVPSGPRTVKADSLYEIEQV